MLDVAGVRLAHTAVHFALLRLATAELFHKVVVVRDYSLLAVLIVDGLQVLCYDVALRRLLQNSLTRRLVGVVSRLGVLLRR